MTYKEIETQYADYLAAMRVGQEQHPDRAYMPHCDMWVLHELGSCIYCDGYPDLQAARRELRIAFTGVQSTVFERPCPATLLRSVEKIEHWHGNVPMTQAQADEHAQQWDEMLREVQRSLGVDPKTM